MSGDTLWDIAGKYLGDPKRWTEIYDANKSLIEDTAKVHPGPPVFGTSDHGHWIFPGTNLAIPTACAAPPVQPPAAAPCPAWEFIGVKGVDKANALNIPALPGVGGGFENVISTLKEKGNVDVDYVEYTPSTYTDVFEDPVTDQAVVDARNGKEPKRTLPGNLPITEEQGKAATIAKLLAEADRCKEVGTHFILAGYSEGAWVLGDALSDPRLNSIHDRIDSVVLFGDPRFNPDSSAAKWTGGAPLRTGGIAAYAQPPGKRDPYLPKDLEAKAQSYCSSSPVDPICAAPGGNLSPRDWAKAMDTCRGGRTGGLLGPV
ncbi:cutinase family protein [Streptomyces avermitilis]|uniref:cutinase family protein n=1 Tax=Streptomyces avermitilis TaxID=33903 RepID=UPI0033AC10C4